MDDSGKLGSTERAKPAVTFFPRSPRGSAPEPGCPSSICITSQTPEFPKLLRTGVQAEHGALLEGEGR